MALPANQLIQFYITNLADLILRRQWTSVIFPAMTLQNDIASACSAQVRLLGQEVCVNRWRGSVRDNEVQEMRQLLT